MWSVGVLGVAVGLLVCLCFALVDRSDRLEQADDVPVGVDVDLLAAWNRRQAGHRSHLADQRRDEARPGRQSDVADRHREAGRPAFRFGSWLIEYWVLAMHTARWP